MTDRYYPTVNRPTLNEVQAAIAATRRDGETVIGWTKRRDENRGWSIHIVTKDARS